LNFSFGLLGSLSHSFHVDWKQRLADSCSTKILLKNIYRTQLFCCVRLFFTTFFTRPFESVNSLWESLSDRPFFQKNLRVSFFPANRNPWESAANFEYLRKSLRFKVTQSVRSIATVKGDQRWPSTASSRCPASWRNPADPNEAIERAAAARENPRGTAHGHQDDRQTTYRRCICDGGWAAMSLLQGVVRGAGAVALLARTMPGLRGKSPGTAGFTAGVHRRLVQRTRLRSGGRQVVDPVGDRLRSGLQQHVHQLAARQLRRHPRERWLPAIRWYSLPIMPGLSEDRIFWRGRRP